MQSLPRWRVSFDDTSLRILTPWFAAVVAHEGYHMAQHAMWSGFSLFWSPKKDFRPGELRFLRKKEVVFSGLEDYDSWVKRKSGSA